MRVCVSMAIQSGTSVTTQTVGENISEGALSDNKGNFLLRKLKTKGRKRSSEA